MVRLSIFGLGYVGLVHAIGFALLGHEVIGYDIDEVKISRLSAGRPTIVEKGIEAHLKRALESGNIRFERSPERAVLESDVTFIAVGTPSAPDGSQDLRYVISSSQTIGRLIGEKGGWHLVVVKSTVLPGTTDGIVRETIESASKRKAFIDFGLASNPEFLREGSAFQDFFKPDRIVIGVRDEKSEEMMMRIYEKIDAPKIVVDPVSAELVKYASNAFLAVKLSFANEMAEMCKALGVDCHRVLHIVGMDHRISQHYFKAGLGFGGSCLPKDLRALIKAFESKGIRPRILPAALEVNERQIDRAISILAKHLGGIYGKRIAVLGLSFKPGTDDVRESRGVMLAKRLAEEGAVVTVHDPVAMENARSLLGSLVRYAPSAQAAVDGSDAVVIATEWEEYENVSYAGKIVVDGRRVERARREASIYEGLAW